MTKSYAEIAEIIQQLRSFHIETERDREFEAQLSRLFKIGEDGALSHLPVLYTGGTETRGITFIEPAGGGKTTAINRVFHEFAPLASNPDTGLPRYLMAQVESPATQKSLGINVLQGLGIEHVDARAKVWEIWSMVRHRLKVMGISVLWIDEAHDLFGSGSRREVDNMFKMLKSLMQGDHPVILILSGTERLAEITGIDPQINRRFTKIKPADLDEVADLPKVNSLVTNFAKLAGLSANLDGLLGQRLVYASRARFGRLVETTIHAVERALIHGREAVCIEDFAQAWATQEGCDDDGNVFLSDHWYEIELDHYDDEVGAVTTAPKAKKARR